MIRPIAASFALAMLMGLPSIAADPPAVASPDGRLRLEVGLVDEGGKAVPRYSVAFDGKPVALPSRLGLDLADGTRLGADSIVEGISPREVSEGFDVLGGKRSRVEARGREAVVSLRERGASGRAWEVVLRAYDDGVALRYRLPGGGRVDLVAERTEFRLPTGASAFALPIPRFDTPHEFRYRKAPVADLTAVDPKGGMFGLPMTAEIPGVGWASILDVEVVDYPGLYLGGIGDGAFAARLAPRPDDPKVVARLALPNQTPWRAWMVADRAERLVESDLALKLAAPSKVADTSWIHPGKTTFPWWNGFFERDVPFKMGLNTATAKHYIDFCAEAGIPYHSLDGLDNIAWYGGTIVPYTGADITRGIAGLDFPEVARYAKSKGVKLRLWMHWKGADTHMDRAFPLYREMGIEGVMVDFLDSDHQDMARYVVRLLETAAKNHLTVTIHNAKEPTGLERTYPNLLTTEGVLNLEYDKWDPIGVTPEHELTIPFTRMLAGPLDFHQGSFRAVGVEAFHPRDKDPLVIGTPSRTLASYVIFQNGLPMVADYPSAYRGHPALATLVAIPESWDETRCLAGAVGESIVVARRKGASWWVGAMTDRSPRSVSVPLAFLGPGRYRATIDRDAPSAPAKLDRRTVEVTPGETIVEALAPAGGLLIRLDPIGGP